MERPAQTTVVTDDSAQYSPQLLSQLSDLQLQIQLIGYPNRVDLIGRELHSIDQAIRRLLYELGARDRINT